jgi:CubicO group peptidase (beta-lactamase class C family)
MLRRLLLFLALTASCRAAEPRDISAELEAVRAEYALPACASAVVKDGKLTAIGAAGLRKADENVRVTVDDCWHTGSCTKSMTAVLVGLLVDEGKLRWDLPISEAFAGLPCHAAWRKVTVSDVVTQRGGLGNSPRIVWQEGGKPTPQAQRESFARILLAKPPPEPVGKFAYSNAGYGLLGALIERASGESYEEMLRSRIFVPLGLTSAGFGAAATPGKVDQPWGHRRRGKRYVPVDPTPGNQFPPVLAPAACVHLSLADFARYAAWISTGEPRLLSPETFAKLHTPPKGSSYAGGMWTTELPGIGGDCVCHTGHLGGMFAVFYASKDTACVAFINVEGGGWEWLGDEVCAAALEAAR